MHFIFSVQEFKHRCKIANKGERIARARRGGRRLNFCSIFVQFLFWEDTRESAGAKMRMMIKKLLKDHHYPPEGMEDAVQTVMMQCELWADGQVMA